MDNELKRDEGSSAPARYLGKSLTYLIPLTEYLIEGRSRHTMLSLTSMGKKDDDGYTLDSCRIVGIPAINHLNLEIGDKVFVDTTHLKRVNLEGNYKSIDKMRELFTDPKIKPADKAHLLDDKGKIEIVDYYLIGNYAIKCIIDEVKLNEVNNSQASAV